MKHHNLRFFLFLFNFMILLLPMQLLHAASVLAEQFVLSNGMTLIVKPDHRAPTAVHMLWVRVGGMDEVDGTSGVAHLLEHMMFRGTPQVPAGEFSRRVAALGGRENAFTSMDYTAFYQQVQVQRLKDVMELEADRFAHNQWDDKDMLREMEVVKEERRMRTEDNARSRLYEQLNAMSYVASPYHRPVIGWMNDLQAMQPDDARSFYRHWYTPSNAVVVIAGDVDVTEVRALAERIYGSIENRATPPRKPREEPEQKGMRRLDFKAPAEQAYVVLAFKVPGLEPKNLKDANGDSKSAASDAFALAVLSAVLDGYTGARLERNLTQAKDHVADSAGASYAMSARGGPVMFLLDGVPSEGKTATLVEAALREEVRRIARDGISEDELNRVKTQWVANEVYAQDSVFNQARILGSHWAQGFEVDAQSKILERLRAVTAGQVKEVAAKYFGDDALNVATLIPQPVDRKAPRRPAIAGMRND